MLFVCAYSMWQRTDGGPQADGDEAHAQWVRRVRAGVGPAAVGSYVNEVSHLAPHTPVAALAGLASLLCLGVPRPSSRTTAFVRCCGRRQRERGAVPSAACLPQVMLEPGQLAHCYRPETLSRVAAVKRRTDPLGLLRALELDPQP